MNSKTITKLLRTPAKVAGGLDWKKLSGSILTIDVGRNHIGMAISSHPAFGEPVQELEPVTMRLETDETNKRRTLAPEVVEEIKDVVKNNNVCGFVVNWPVQKEGRCGAPCGRVLHALDSIVNHDESSSILSPSRPCCLWDGNHTAQKEDEWGRAAMYGEPSTSKTLHIASLEQYNREADSSTAADIWNDFCRSQWPELYQYNDTETYNGDFQTTEAASSESEFCDSEWLDNYEDTGRYMKAAAF